MACGWSPELTDKPFPLENPQISPRLVGIFIEVRRSESVMVATNIIEHFKLMIGPHPALLARMDKEIASRAYSHNAQGGS